ncbi:MAG: PDZ domain-containing protein [Gemmatimonadetes bacterium]|uniref:PDZ domain-containing protein n=1 Tax=Candidatus Kutchimonas denitrificans TaxID=3056748 RepID=A0AAE4Z6J9_9BACT|nr:PDZ domain-containing protein [Gemmatimonadota bacterium]NIR74679.1 PDZ domain-containing protein [Candidatus Kutchimonas denitrificans]NIS01429.1 PDZ domain-containing protein [Gemmatimonadota bacterium]NIT67170.1 PDZ domain-containing protein [Gemmatimonadota bacterium]NIU52344.1 PDZ domain-containing protein [Gemmatimonadota bacterium]
MRWANLAAVGALGTVAATGSLQPAWGQEVREECVCPERSRTGVWVAPRGEPFSNIYYFNTQPRLGVYIHMEANPETDRYGALIDDVSEGGPADEAGIQAGDVIVRVAGKSVLEGHGDYPERVSAPGQRLVELARELEIGDTVQVEYRRDGETRTTQLAVGDFGGNLRFGWLSGPDSLHFRADSLDLSVRRWYNRLQELPEVSIRAPRSFAIAIGERLPGLELVELNPDLGEYFGTEEGVLIISAPEDSELGLKAGDVIQEIDGRTVRDPSHAMRILRSYEEDEEVTFSIFRNKRKRTVTGKVPETFFGGVYGVRRRNP